MRFPSSAPLVIRSTLLLLGAALLVCPAESAAVGRVRRVANVLPAVSIATPSFGASLYANFPDGISPFYDPATETIEVVGAFGNVPVSAIKRGSWGVFLDGSSTPATMVVLTPPHRVGRVRVVSGYFTQRIGVSNHDLWPIRSITAELAHAKTGKVFARARTVFYDLRRDGNAVTNRPTDSRIVGTSTQLTDRGLGKVASGPEAVAGLETAYLSSLPQPTLSAFNDTLSANARALSRYDDDGDTLHACIDLDAVSESRFRDVLQFAPYRDALAWAAAQYAAYANRDTICPALVNPIAIAACFVAAEASCVKSQPTAADFELCVDQIEGDPRSLVMDAVSDVQLGFLQALQGTGARIRSHVTVDGLHASIDGRLRSLFVRWKNPLCVARPRENLADATIDETDWIRDWTSCPDMRVDVANASTLPNDASAVFRLEQQASDEEQFAAEQVSAGTFTFGGSDVDANRGTCAASFVRADAEAMLATFVGPLEQTFADTWFGGAPASQQARAFERLASPYGIGTVDVPAHELSAPLAQITSEPGKGMVVMSNTKVLPVDVVTERLRRPGFFYAPVVGNLFSDDDLDERNDPFDAAYAITTGFLNQILNVRAGGTALRFDYTPTWGELEPFGVAIPAGAAATDLAPLTGATLAAFDPGFRGLGDRTEFTISVEPLFDPIVFMTSDVTPQHELPVVNTPITYGIAALSVSFKANALRVRGAILRDVEVLRLQIGFSDEEFRFVIDEAPHARFLIPDVRSDAWGGIAVKNLLPRCAMDEHDAGHGVSCEGMLERKVTDLLAAHLRPTFLDLLSSVPAPLWFDVRGDATTPVHHRHQSRYQIGQVITYYGGLDAVE